MTFREQLLHDHLTEHEMEHAAGLLWALKLLEENVALPPSAKRDLRHGLDVIAAYKHESAELSGIEGRRAGAAEIRNLNSIATLLRVLAHELGLSLIEPGQGC